MVVRAPLQFKPDLNKPEQCLQHTSGGGLNTTCLVQELLPLQQQDIRSFNILPNPSGQAAHFINPAKETRH
jgi:hypothetical protein